MMKKQTTLGCMILLSIHILSFIVYAQTKESEDDLWWFNLHSSPLKIEKAQKGNIVFLTNYSLKEITGFQLGCVSQNLNVTTVYKKLRMQKIKLLPMNSKGELHFESLESKPDYQKFCNDREFTVVKVHFIDNTIWDIKSKSLVEN